MKVAIFGMGGVGLPLACLASKKHDVIGVDIDKEKIELINDNICPIQDGFIEEEFKNSSINATFDAEYAVEKSDIIILCLPTPVDELHHPDLSAITSASRTISKVLKKGSLLIVESTIAPRTCREVVKPILEESGLIAEKDFYLVHCPERIDPGNKVWRLKDLPRVIGGLSDKGRNKAVDFYRSIIGAEMYELSSIEAAEAVKIVENSFRDVNIAFVNELARSFDKMNIDIIEVIKGASTKPFAFMPHYPGCGVGGHCISVDPYYLIESAKNLGFEHEFLSLAREINDGMPKFTVEKLNEGLSELGEPIKGAKIAVLGLAYKRDINDIRESPSLKIVELLKKLGAELTIYDSYLPEKSTVENIGDALRNEFIIIATDHKEFKEIDPCVFKEKGVKLIVDGRNCLDKDKIKSLGIIYKGIGR